MIDLFAKLFEVPAKEASHLLACAYGIQPYTSAEVEAVAVSQMVKLPATNNAPAAVKLLNRRNQMKRGKYSAGLNLKPCKAELSGFRLSSGR